MNVWKMQIPTSIRKMPLSEFLNRHNGNIRSVLKEIANRAYISSPKGGMFFYISLSFSSK